MEGLNQKLLDYASNIVPSMGTATTIAIIVSIVLAVIYCFFGYKLLRVHISFVMFVIGATIGFVIGVLIGLDQTFVLALVAVLAILFALVGFFLYKVGLFVMIMVLVASSSYGFLSGVFKANYVLIGCIAVSVLFAILSCIVTRPLVIILTALAGGLIVSNNLIDHFLVQVAMLNTPRTTEYIVLGFALLLAIFGMIFQFRTTENYEYKRTRKKD